jgi:hypothetical protein
MGNRHGALFSGIPNSLGRIALSAFCWSKCALLKVVAINDKSRPTAAAEGFPGQAKTTVAPFFL